MSINNFVKVSLYTKNFFKKKSLYLFKLAFILCLKFLIMWDLLLSRYATASARSDGLLLLCGGRDANSVVSYLFIILRFLILFVILHFLILLIWFTLEAFYLWLT